MPLDATTSIRRWPRGLRWLSVALGAFAVSFGAKAVTIAAAEAHHPQATEMPASWQRFARRLQLELQARLSSDGADAQRFRDTMARLDKGAAALVIQVWVAPDGKVQRLELEGQPNGDALHELYGALLGEGVGAVPADMPQRMRLSPGAKPEN